MLATYRKPTKEMFSFDKPVLAAYGGFGFIGWLIYHLVAERQASSVLTMSAIAQSLGVTLLCIQSLGSGRATGISAKSLLLDALAIAFRLSSTLWLDGYIPTDRSGDFHYQAFDVLSLLLLIFLLHRVLVVQHATYQADDDTLHVAPLVMLSVTLAVVLHGDMVDSIIFDSLWLAGLFTSVVAVLPQLWLITSTGGWAGALTSHYIAAMALSRFLSGCFMWLARNHIVCKNFIAGFEHTIYAIFFAHIVHIILLADFAFQYLRSNLRGAVCQSVHFVMEI